MTLPIASVNTKPYCGSCGWEVNQAFPHGDRNSDLFCDSCGADLIAYGFTAPTGATAGTPGSLDPAGVTLPWDLLGLQAYGALGESTAWTTGQNVVLADQSLAHWDGAAWAAGAAT